jgi:hypothetical protein
LIGEPDNRHRRRRGTIGIKTKVMSLDRVLDQKDTTWLGTEQDKQHLFTRKLSIPAIFLPTKRYPALGMQTIPRHFGERFRSV